MRSNYFQEEETYLFSYLLRHIQSLTQQDVGIATQCFLTVFWKVYRQKLYLEPLLVKLEKEIKSYNSDPTREFNRTIKVFVCAIYKTVKKKTKYNDKIKNYLNYAKISKDWLGQPRIACCLSFLKNNPLREYAENYLKENFSEWLSNGRDEFIAVALLALSQKISKGDLQRILEYIELKINDLPLNLISLYLIGISQTNLELPNKDGIEDKLYKAIRDKIKVTTHFEDEEIISSATALFVAKYHKISGYFAKYSKELKEILALKNDLIEDKKRVSTRNLLLCTISIACISLVCLLFFFPLLIEFPIDLSLFGKFLLALSTKKGLALGSSIVLLIYILVSYLKTGDPIFGIFEFIQDKLPGLFKFIKGNKGK